MFYVTGLIGLVALIIRITRWIRRRQQERELRRSIERTRQILKSVPKIYRSTIPAGRPSEFQTRDGYNIEITAFREYRLLDGERRPVFSDYFEDIRYDAGSRLFICRLDSGGKILDAATGKKYDTPYGRVFVDEYRNFQYQQEDKGCGLLDAQFQLLTGPDYSSIFGLAEGLFRVRKQQRTFIIDSTGQVILEDVERVMEKPMAGRRIVRMTDGRVLLYRDSDGHIRELPYSEVYELYRHNSSIPQKDLRFYRAILHPERGKRRAAVLTADGDELLPETFDHISAESIDGRYFFVTGTGDFQAIGLQAGQASEAGVTLDGRMKFSVWDEDGTILIPPVYDYIEIGFDCRQLIVNQGGHPETIQWHDDHYDEGHTGWTIRGGKFGVVEPSGKVLIPLEEWYSFEADYIDAEMVWRYIARKTPDGEAVHFNMAGERVQNPEMH